MVVRLWAPLLFQVFISLLTEAVLRLVGLLWATISLAMTILWLVGFRWMLAFPWLLILVPCVGDLLAHLKFSVVDAKWIRRSNCIAFALGVSALKIHLEKLYGKKEKVSAAPDTFFSFSFPFSSLTIFCALFRLNYVVAFFFFLLCDCIHWVLDAYICTYLQRRTCHTEFFQIMLESLI